LAQRTYTTSQGDAWDEVSKWAYGSELYMHEIMAANPEYRDYVTFPGGIVLTVPDVDVRQFPTVTPPWKRAV
jgi:phage tail protein X